MQEIEITQLDADIFEMFLERADNMRQLSYFQKYTKRSVTIGVDEKSMKIDEEIPTEESIVAVASLLRPFYLNDELVNYLSVNSKLRRICEKIGKDDWADILVTHREGYLKTLKYSPIGITFQGKTLSPKEILDLFLYGKYAHHHIEKHKQLKKLGDLLPVVRLLLMQIVDELYQSIYKTANVYFHLRRDFKITIAEAEKNAKT